MTHGEDVFFHKTKIKYCLHFAKCVYKKISPAEETLRAIRSNLYYNDLILDGADGQTMFACLSIRACSKESIKSGLSNSEISGIISTSLSHLVDPIVAKVVIAQFKAVIKLISGTGQEDAFAVNFARKYESFHSVNRD